MATTPICPCDAQTTAALTNLPGLSQIAFRAGDFNDFRRALLTPLLTPEGQPAEQSLTQWSSGLGIVSGADPAVADFAVMMVEWWAYLADILTFYNQRIANEDYLRTATLIESTPGLVRLLGYRPRPAIAATGTLAALVTAGQTATLPAHLQFQSKPGPGQTPQTFELTSATPIAAPDKVPANPQTYLVGTPPPTFHIDPLSIITAPLLVEAARDAVDLIDISASTTPAATSSPTTPTATTPSASKAELFKIEEPVHVLDPILIDYSEIPDAITVGDTAATLLLQGTVTTVTNGTPFLLGTRDDTATPNLIQLTAAPVAQNTAAAGKQTVLTFNWTPPSTPLSASNARLRRANQTSALWTVNSTPFASSTSVHLAGVARSIKPGDWVVFTSVGTGSQPPQLVQISATQDVFGDATAAGGPGSAGTETGAINVLHTLLTLDQQLPSGMPATGTTVLFDWVEFATLMDQPPANWDGSTDLYPVQPATFSPFPATTASPNVLLQDSAGNGVSATMSLDGTALSCTPTQTFSPTLQPPINVFFNLLAVTRGKTVTNEIVGSGDATVAGQSFKLAKSPVTYLATGATYASTITVTVNQQPWKEVAFFYGQPANAQVFVTREDSQQNTYIDFGDGVNGSRLPTGSNNVVATYRVGGGLASPPAGKLTVIAQSWPGLRQIMNPVAVGGGSDPDPASLLKQYAPQSVLTFNNRAVSVADYQAIASQVSGVTAALALWTWNASLEQAGVTVYVAGDASAAKTALTQAGDPNRPVNVQPATPITVTLTLFLIVVPGMDTGTIEANVTTALCDPLAGLFALSNLGIGQNLFYSQIEAACLAVNGVVAISASTFTANGATESSPLHNPGVGGYYTLAATGLNLTTEPDPNA